MSIYLLMILVAPVIVAGYYGISGKAEYTIEESGMTRPTRASAMKIKSFKAGLAYRVIGHCPPKPMRTSYNFPETSSRLRLRVHILAQKYRNWRTLRFIEGEWRRWLGDYISVRQLIDRYVDMMGGQQFVLDCLFGRGMGWHQQQIEKLL
jgi:hypothetical protein